MYDNVKNTIKVNIESWWKNHTASNEIQISRNINLGISDVGAEVREQTQKTTRIVGCLNDTIWRNRNIGTETKSRIYKAVIRPIMTYTAETGPNTSKIKQLLETTKMRVLRTLFDRERSENVRERCKVENINSWVLNRKVQWNKHLNRMDDRRIVRITRDKSLLGRRNVGSPRKRWSDNLNA